MIEARWLVIAFALLGVISGAISTAGIIAVAPPNDFTLLAIFLLPGFAFGVVIGSALAYAGWLSPKRFIVWVVFATLGHFAAALCVTGATWRLQATLLLSEQTAIAIAAAWAGAIGGGLLAVANRLLVPGSRWTAPMIVGAILGPLVLLHDAGPVLGRLLFYIIWQGSYAAALAVALPASQRVYSAKNQ